MFIFMIYLYQVSYKCHLYHKQGILHFQESNKSWVEGRGKSKDFMTGRTLHDSAGFMLANPLGFPPEVYNGSNPSETKNSTYNYLMAVYGYANNTEDLVHLIIEQYPDLVSDDYDARSVALALQQTDQSFGVRSHWEAEMHSG